LGAGRSRATTEPFLTCEGVISESLSCSSAHLRKGFALQSLGRGIIVPGFFIQHQLTETIRLISRYQDTPMSSGCVPRPNGELRDEAIILTPIPIFRSIVKRIDK